MKIYCLIASLILSFSSISQKSYYFSDPVPSATSKIDQVDKNWHGTYKSKDGTLSYQMDEKGISIISTNVSSISRETIRESSKYDVRNKYIFGVVDNDSIPCILEEDRYYFGIQNTDVFVGDGSQNILTKTAESNVFIINKYENGNYIPVLLEFKGKKLTMSYFDYDSEDTKFDFIENQTSIDTQYQKLIILSPSETEFTELKTKGIFDYPKLFKD